MEIADKNNEFEKSQSPSDLIVIEDEGWNTTVPAIEIQAWDKYRQYKSEGKIVEKPVSTQKGFVVRWKHTEESLKREQRGEKQSNNPKKAEAQWRPGSEQLDLFSFLDESSLMDSEQVPKGLTLEQEPVLQSVEVEVHKE